MITEVCTIKITMRDQLDNYREEDIVKNLWPMLVPWFTRRHGVERGKIILSDGAVEVDWQYETNYPKDDDDDMADIHGAEPALTSD